MRVRKNKKENIKILAIIMLMVLIFKRGDVVNDKKKRYSKDRVFASFFSKIIGINQHEQSHISTMKKPKYQS